MRCPYPTAAVCSPARSRLLPAQYSSGCPPGFHSLAPATSVRVVVLVRSAATRSVVV